LSSVLGSLGLLFAQGEVGEVETEVEIETEVEVKIETELEAGDPSQARDDSTQHKKALLK